MAVIIGISVIVIILAIMANLPTVVISTSGVMASSFFQYIRAAMYFLPLGTVISILSLIFTLWTIRVLFGLGKTIKDLFTI